MTSQQFTSLLNAFKNLNYIIAANGTYFLEVTTAHTNLKLKQLYINSDAVFTTLTITKQDGTTVSGLTSLNISGQTISKGGILTPPSGSYFSAVTMSSGNAIGIIL